MVMAVNMMDIVAKNGDQINIAALSKNMGCEAVEISALKGTGITEAAEKAVALAQKKTAAGFVHSFAPEVESVLTDIEALLPSDIAQSQKRFYAIKLFERDDKIADTMSKVPDVESIIKAAEDKLDDDSESIITNERYVYIASIIEGCYVKKNKQSLTISDKIDRIVTNRWLACDLCSCDVVCILYFRIHSWCICD